MEKVREEFRRLVEESQPPTSQGQGPGLVIHNVYVTIKSNTPEQLADLAERLRSLLRR